MLEGRAGGWHSAGSGNEREKNSGSSTKLNAKPCSWNGITARRRGVRWGSR